MTLGQARAIPAARIAAINVVKGGATAAGKGAEIHITTVPESGAVSVGPGLTLRAHGLTDSPDGMSTRGPAPQILTHGFNGLLFIDGKRGDPSALSGLKPSRIEKIEVLEGVAARRLYNDPAASNGVIRITTRH